MQSLYAVDRPSGFPVHPPMLSQPGQVNSPLDDPDSVLNQLTAKSDRNQKKSSVEQIRRTSPAAQAINQLPGPPRQLLVRPEVGMERPRVAMHAQEV